MTHPTALPKRPSKLHIYEEHRFVMIHTNPNHLWWPLKKEIEQTERWGSPKDERELQRMRQDAERLHELFKKAQSTIMRIRAQGKAEAAKAAREDKASKEEYYNCKKVECCEDECCEEEYCEDEDDEAEGLYLNMWCSIPLDEKLPKYAIQRLITSDLDLESTKLAAKAYYNINPTLDRLAKIKVDNCLELNVLLQVIDRVHEGLWEMEIGGHQYKVVLNFEMHSGFGFSEVRAVVPIRLADYIFNDIRAVDDRIFYTSAGSSVRISAQQALDEMRLRPTGEKNEEDYKLAETAKRMNTRVGTQLGTKGNFIQRNQHWWSAGLTFRSHGTSEKPQKAIVEPKLGLHEDGDRLREVKANELPLVRTFSLERKQYGFFDIRDVADYKFDRVLLDQLVMPESNKNVLTSVIGAKPGSVMADIVRGKHGGFVVLAAGPTGVGKTLTAEAVSEWLERPLYAVEVAELGTDVDRLESTLGEIFIRASRWNAILLFDEADVFLAKRNLDLERSAIVGVFLRLLDYHDGVIFMTTNRADIIDPAMFSRLSMLLEYKPLARKARNLVWNVMLDDAPELKKLSKSLSRLPLNGRQIRNTARVIRALDSQREDTISEKEVLEVTAIATRARLTLWRRFVSWLGY